MTREDDGDLERRLAASLERGAPQPSDDLLDRVQSAVRQTPQSGAIGGAGRRWLIGTTAAIAIAGAAVGIFTLRDVPSALMGDRAAAASPSASAQPQSVITWEEPAAYTFVINDLNCGGGERNYIGEWRVEVRDHAVAGVAQVAGGPRRDPPALDRVPTLGQIVAKVHEAESGGDGGFGGIGRPTHGPGEPPEFEVETDPMDGHPTRVFIDWVPNGIDDEECYVITEYQPAP